MTARRYDTQRTRRRIDALRGVLERARRAGAFDRAQRVEQAIQRESERLRRLISAPAALGR